jgi:predicted Rossmann fold flavoprotein
VFPVTDDAKSIVEVLKKELRKNKVKVLCNSAIKDIVLRDNGVKAVMLGDGRLISADRIILATGGASYGFTGSTGEGIALAGKLGHSIVPLRPGLVPLEIRQPYAKVLAGLTLKNIRIKFICEKREIISEVGELLFTHSGISGPLVLTFSGRICEWLGEGKQVQVEIDLKPGLSREQLDGRLLREFSLNAKKSLKNILKNLVPLKLVDVFIGISDINPLRKVSQISRQERGELVSLLKGWRMDVSRARPIDEAMVTRGGVSLREINPRTMESRRIKGLYFCGEMIDVDADTGGFNLQAAFSTGYLAGESAAA